MYLQIAALVANIGIYIFVEWRKMTLNDMHLCTWTWFGGSPLLRITVDPSDFARVPVRATTNYTCKFTARAKFETVPPDCCESEICPWLVQTSVRIFDRSQTTPRCSFLITSQYSHSFIHTNLFTVHIHVWWGLINRNEDLKMTTSEAVSLLL